MHPFFAILICAGLGAVGSLAGWFIGKAYNKRHRADPVQVEKLTEEVWRRVFLKAYPEQAKNMPVVWQETHPFFPYVDEADMDADMENLKQNFEKIWAEGTPVKVYTWGSMRAAVEDLWGQISKLDMECLSPDTIELAKANHEWLSHHADPDV